MISGGLGQGTQQQAGRYGTETVAKSPNPICKFSAKKEKERERAQAWTFENKAYH